MEQVQSSRSQLRRLTAAVVALACLLLAVWPGSSRAASPRVGYYPNSRLNVGHAHIFPKSQYYRRIRSYTAGSTSQLLYNAGGKVMNHGTNYLIFWQPSASYHFDLPPNTDSSYESLIKRFFNDVGGSSFYNILTQYSSWTGTGSVAGGPILNQSVLAAGGVVTDTNAFPASGCPTLVYPVCILDSQIQTEIQNVVAAQNWTVNGTSEFFLFLPLNVDNCFDAAGLQCFNNVYCAYHSSFTTGGKDYVYAMMGDDGTGSGCATPYSPNNDLFADSEISTISHEMFESVSETYIAGANAWQDQTGSEIGDKCAYFYPTNLNLDNSDVTLNGHDYLVQEEWSNLSLDETGSATGGCALSLPRSGPGAGPGVTPVASRIPA